MKIKNELREEDGSYNDIALKLNKDAQKVIDILLEKYKNDFSIDSICSEIARTAFSQGSFENAIASSKYLEKNKKKKVKK